MFHLAILWDWEYDKPFLDLAQVIAHELGIQLLYIGPSEVNEWLAKEDYEISWFLDRASESSPEFLPLIDKFLGKRIKAINDPSKVRFFLCKARTHQHFEASGFCLPESLVLPPSKDKEMTPVPLSEVGLPCVVKPALGGGGEGVVLGVRDWAEVEKACQVIPDQEFLVQRLIKPRTYEHRKCWFRCYFVCGDVFLYYWDANANEYCSLGNEGDEKAWREELENILCKVAKTTELRCFSSEMALDEDGKIYLVDYMNDPIDLRPQSFHGDGVPDALLKGIIEAILTFVKKEKTSSLSLCLE